MLKYLNDTEAEVKLTLPPKEGEDLPSEITVAPGDEIEISDDVARGFLHYELNAAKVEKAEPAPEDESAPEGETEAVVETKEEAEGDVATDEKEEEKAEEELADAAKDAEEAESEGEAETKVEETHLSEAEMKLAEEKARLAEEKREFAREKAEAKFKEYVAEGKATPAQKEAYMALSMHEGAVRVSEGKEQSVSELLNSLFESAAQHSLYEEEGVDGEGKEEPELTDEEKEVAEMFGNSEENIKAIKNEGK